MSQTEESHAAHDTAASHHLLNNAITSSAQILFVAIDGPAEFHDNTTLAAGNALAAGIEEVNAIGIGNNASVHFAMPDTDANAFEADSVADLPNVLSLAVNRRIGEAVAQHSVPEPGMLTLGLVAGAMVLCRRKRRT